MAGTRFPNEADSVSDGYIFDIRTESLDNSHTLAAERYRKLNCTGMTIECLAHKLSSPLLNIEKINACRFDANKSLPTGRNRYREFFQLHHVWTAVSMNANCLHRGPLRYMRRILCA
jgi:hypothetical protein